MKRFLVFVLAATVVLLGAFPLPSLAQRPSNYFAAKAGAYIPNSDDLDDLDFDTGFNGEVTLGHYFTPNIALELGVGYFQSGSDTFFDPSLGSFDFELDVIPVTANVRLAFPMANFEPYLLAGIGVYFADLEVDTDFFGSDSEDDEAFGFQLGVGANFDLTPNIFLGGEAKYFWAEPEFGGVDIEINGYQLTANVGFRF